MSGLADLRLGFIPLTDCAPLIVAKALGFFAEEGLDVDLSREVSWATIRDKVTVGALDGAHMLAPMALASTMGAGGLGDAVPIIAPLAMNLNGSAITVSASLAAMLRDVDPQGMSQHPITARPLARLVERRKTRGEPLLTFAVVFTYSMHAYELRYWMAEAGIDPDHDIRLVVTPPPRMVEQLRLGGIDGFCVGAPWNAVAVQEGLGEVLIKASEFWPGSPDKVFGVKALWAETYPDELRAALRAMIRASAWADDPANRESLVALLSRPEHIGAPAEAIDWALRDEIVFHDGAAGLPRREHALWFLSQMVRWGQVEAEHDLGSAANQVYRPDLFRAAATSLGPTIAPEMAFADAAKGPAMTLFDGLEFTPEAAALYAACFPITRVKAI
ncbi:thiamine biosynthesis protein [Caulobacter sp. B11]|uniref:CmpA/NrtA family ABC transporter substrate-binding protein n=1 Tax=Caulobacter sp. B11 TaxID=2048899 RepID=UPI000C12A4EC|nr:CmpA/NrtA family ABC transporter substrate-binding protein [Caulobacter sp. B11]PHY14264.1 thiamine biosynthesis protein [Caulobacter sp. B11]